MGYGILLSWIRPDAEAGYTKVRIYRSSTINGTYSNIAEQLITDTTYWDVSGTTSSWYKITFIIPAVVSPPSAEVESDKSVAMKGIPALTNTRLIIEKAQLAGNESAVNNALVHILEDVYYMIRDLFGNPFYAVQLNYNSNNTVQSYGIGERDAMYIDRVYSLDTSTTAPTRAELVKDVDYYYDPIFGEITLLTTQKSSSGADLDLYVEFTPKIYQTLATAMAARMYLRKVFVRSGDKLAAQQLGSLDEEIKEIRNAIARRVARRVSPDSQVQFPTDNSDFAVGGTVDGQSFWRSG
jgi:hypothetical protein